MGKYTYKPQYGVIVICADEKEQRAIYEPITAATWFWANDGYDTGDICEQEIVRIDYSLRPRDFYAYDILPAMIRTLNRCLDNIQMGYIRRIPQVERYSSYDKRT